MKTFLTVIAVIFFLGCKQSSEINTFEEKKVTKTENAINIKNVEVSKSELILNQLQGVWYYKEEPYNGYALKYHENNTIKEKLGFYNGKRQGVSKTWSENGVLRIKSYYNQNKLVGIYKSFWENGNLALKVNYVNGKKQGEEKQWYSNGKLSKLRLLKDGKENGIQKAWLPTGQLYVNYEAKNGRTFGLMRANSCYKLENEKVIISK